MNVLVTGVTGFLGGRIAERLVERDWQVRGLVRDPQGWAGAPAEAARVVGDVKDVESLRRAAEGCGTIVHAAALVRAWFRDSREYDRVNVQGLANVLRVARESGARVVYISSFIALGPTDGRIFDEQTPRVSTGFHNHYERTKWIADRLAREAEPEGSRPVRIYPGVVYGPGALTAGNHVVDLLLKHARGELPGMLGHGNLRQCFAYVDDVVEGVAQAARQAPHGAGYILGGENATARELFAAFHEASGVRPPRRRIPFAVASLIGRIHGWRARLFGVEPELTAGVVGIYRHEWAYSSAKAERELGYRITPLKEGVARTVAWLRETGEL